MNLLVFLVRRLVPFLAKYPLRIHPLIFCSCIVFVGVAPAADSLYFRRIGTWSAGGSTYGVAVAGDYAYVAGDSMLTNGLHVVSIADPANPTEVGFFHSLAMAWGVAVSGEYAYLANDTGGLRVISVADPAHPVEVGRDSTGIAIYTVAVSGDYVYMTDVDDFHVLSIADPAHPVELGHCRSHGVYWHMKVVGDYAYLPSDWGMRIISVADPAHPVEVGSYQLGMVEGVDVQDGYVYLGVSDSNSFLVASISDPTNPVEVGRVDSLPGTPTAIVLTHGYAFCGCKGLLAISIADPAHPRNVGHYLGGGQDIAVHADFVYAAYEGLQVYQFYQLGDLDVDPDSLDVAADTLRPRRWTTVTSSSFRRSDEVAIGGISTERPFDSHHVASPPSERALGVTAGAQFECAHGEFILANTSAAYNPDPSDGPSVSPVDSISFTGSLTGPGGTIDSITIPNLPKSLAQGQSMVCTLAAYVPIGLKVGNYTGSIYIGGKDTANLQVYESCYVCVSKLGDIDVDNDSLDVVADTIRTRIPITGDRMSGRPDRAVGAFVLANTSASYNPDTADGPSLSWVDSLSFTASLTGPGGNLDSIFIQNFPASLARGRAVVCTLVAYLPESLPIGDYTGSIVITGLDSVHYQVAETVCALVKKGVGVLGDLDVDDDSLSVVRDTMDLHTQPAGPVYAPYAKAEFMLVNTSSAYNPDTADGPSRSTLKQVKAEVEVKGRNGSVDSVYILNLPESLAVGQAVECTLALVVPVGTSLGGYSGWVTVSGYDTLGYQVRDSFFLGVRGPQPRQNLDSLRVAPIPFKPNQNPEHDAIHFQGLSAGARVIVYDASGQSVWSAAEQGDGHLKWDAKVASGIYVYLVVAKDGQSKVGKLSVIR